MGRVKRLSRILGRDMERSRNPFLEAADMLEEEETVVMEFCSCSCGVLKVLVRKTFDFSPHFLQHLA